MNMPFVLNRIDLKVKSVRATNILNYKKTLKNFNNILFNAEYITDQLTLSINV